MKKQNIVKEASVGINIELTTIDQLVLGKQLDIIENYDKAMEAYRSWNGEGASPIYPSEVERDNAIKNILVFLNKIAVKPSSSNIFEEEK